MNYSFYSNIENASITIEVQTYLAIYGFVMNKKSRSGVNIPWQEHQMNP